jgi:ferredoxin
MEICPENVISLDPGPTIADRCSGCGLCQRVCPTGVFHNELLSDHFMLNMMTSLSRRDQIKDEKRRLFIYCHRADNQGNDSIKVPCLGSIKEETLLVASLSVFDEVILRKGDCYRCRFKEGEKLLACSIATARTVFESIGAGEYTVKIEEKEGGEEEVLSRRDLFLKISNKVKNKTVSFLDQGEKVIRNSFLHTIYCEREKEDGKRPSPVRELIGKVIEHKFGGNNSIIKYNPEYPWGNLRIDERRCTACGTCVQICPTGAISEKSENGRKLIYFNSYLCSNCSLCREACLNKAIEVEEDFDLADIFKGKEKIAAEITLTSCIICGEIIRAGSSKLCPTCQKRQVQPIFVKV